MRQPVVTWLAVAALLVAAAPPAAAQSPLPIEIGQRVRIWNDAPKAIAGRVVSINANVVEVADDADATVTVAAKTIRRVEVSSKSRGTGFWKGAVVGAAILGGFGALLNGLQHEQIGEPGSTSAAEAVALGAFSGALFGGLIGGAIGAARGAERWQQVWP